MDRATQRPMEPRDLTRIRFVSDPQVSPDGARVAFVVTTLSEEQDAYLSNIWVVDSDGGLPRQFTTAPKRDTNPRWSPDGRWLAFLSEREARSKRQLYVMPADGGEPVKLTSLANGVSDMAWSPDSGRLCLVSRVGGWQEPENDEDKQKSKPPRRITTFKHKLNGEGFTHDRRSHLFLVDRSGGDVVPLTDGDWNDSEPTWSPDGAAVAFVSARHQERDLDNVTDIWVVPVGGGEPRRVTDSTGPFAGPLFSPDGNLIACVDQRHRNEAGRNNQVFVVPSSGGAPRGLSADLDRDCHAPLQWLDQGQALAFLVDERGNVPLWRTSRSGKVERVVGGDRQISAFSASADGERIAFAASRPSHPTEIFLADSNGCGERQVTDLNRDWKAEVSLAEPEHFQFERAGFVVDAWVMRPIGYQPGRTYPTLLNIHGGPMSQYGNTFFDEFQTYAAAGYAVVYANPRGSQGVGEAFTRAVVGDWGGGDYEDVVTALDEAQRRFDFIDPDRLGVLGGSYGGFMTSWIIGHTDRFKAACSERAVNNLVSMYGTSDISPRFPEAQMGESLWDNFDAYWKRSPLAYAPRVTTPVLILHSENDLRCPIEQAEQYFLNLKRLGKETEFVRFPDESHELSRSGKPRHRLERFQIILEWFHRYLQPATAGDQPG